MSEQNIKQMIAKSFMDIADGLQSGDFSKKYTIGIAADGSEHGDDNLLQAVKLAEGTIDRVPVQNREIIRAVLCTQAKNVLMMHNHPSGSLRPTAEDIDLTRRVMHALESIEVLLVDHLIIGADGYFSFMNNQIGDTGAKPRPALMYAAEDEF